MAEQHRGTRRGAGGYPPPLAVRSTLLVVFALASCGYTVHAQGHLPENARQIFVRPLEDHTTDADAGALVAAALRRELARRGADAGPGAPAQLEGAVEGVSFGASSPNGAIYRLTLSVTARLVVAGQVASEQRSQRSEDWLAGQDPLESEGRRRLALRHAAEAAAREIVERLEVP
ncbi:MAG TPA: LPS assembly lipoprotein LptE [Anaeromyxobacteraceae bacterium]|nr:LPS assembly lipoprotein LptE [Anaeromyxobacteraceae bacterium]